jgi:ribosomal protein L11 methyltransferase
MMERVEFEGLRVLDVGTGTGILAMVALASMATSVLGLDTDPIATFVASSTCRLNGWKPLLLAGGLAAIHRSSSCSAFDVVVANILLSRIRPEFSRLASWLKPGGLLLLSGLLESQRSEATEELAALGLRYWDHRVREEWAALALEKTS